MGREKKYTAVGLRKAVENYFESISRTVPVTEEVWTGELDSYGHKVMEERTVCNDAGEQILHREFLIPPTVSGLCESLGIHRATWARYCDEELHPEFCDTTLHARGRLEYYLEEQLLTRKNVRGIIFSLQNNYGYTEKKEVELGSRAAAAVGATMSAEEKMELLALLKEEADDPEGTD